MARSIIQANSELAQWSFSALIDRAKGSAGFLFFIKAVGCAYQIVTQEMNINLLGSFDGCVTEDFTDYNKWNAFTHQLSSEEVSQGMRAKTRNGGTASEALT